MSTKPIVRIANILNISHEEATAYCEEVRRASRFGSQLSYTTIARHLRGKKPPFPTPGALASIIKQQETFRITKRKESIDHRPTTEKFSTSKALPLATNSDSAASGPSTISTERLEKCPYCWKQLNAEYLPEHIKLFHDDDFKLNLKKEATKGPLLDGIEVQSPDLIRDLKRRAIDEHGFLVSTDLIPETKLDKAEAEGFHRTSSSRNIEQSNVFDSIKALDSYIPGARIKKLRPGPSQQVVCPVCHRQTDYQNLFDHVTTRHPQENAKFVLAKFNRDYERLAEKKSHLDK
jgi:hypothetical protein